MLNISPKYKPFSGLFWVVILATYISACFPQTPPPPRPTDSPAPSPTSTQTVIWFPPTATHTPLPPAGATPTPEEVPNLGPVLFSDDFENFSIWITGNPGNGTVGLGIDEITLAITIPRGYLYSYRSEPILTDFYMEITASTSLCAGMDEYGVLFRYNSPVDFYRFSLSCDGRTRLDKLVGGTASSPQPWLESASVPRVAPSVSRIGIWVRQDEMRFYINDEFQFQVTDRILSSGLIGVFARSAGENAVTVSFSDLVIYQVQP